MENTTGPIPLPQPTEASGMTLADALHARCTHRRFRQAALSMTEIAALLHAGQGQVQDRCHGQVAGRRIAPSAGSQYPLELWLAVARVGDLAPGVYRYDSAQHLLQLRRSGALSGLLESGVIGNQPWASQASAVIAIAADVASMKAHFADQEPSGARGARYAAMEAGAVSQNIHLMATALGLGCVLVGGFDDARIARALALDESLQPMALMCIGAVDS